MTDQKRFDRLFENSKKYSLTKYLGMTARDMQKCIRAEAGAFEGHVKAVVAGRIETFYSPLGQVVCVTCGVGLPWSDKRTNAGHFVPGRSASIVLEEFNVAPQCSYDNCYLHGKVDAYELYMREVYGQDVIDQLRWLKHQPKIWTKEALVLKRIEYLDRIKSAIQTMSGHMPEPGKKKIRFKVRIGGK